MKISQLLRVMLISFTKCRENRLWYLTYYSYLLKSGQFSQIIATQQLPYFLWICFKNGRGTIFDKKCVIVKLLSLYRMHFICFILFPNASQNRIIFCDRMITNHAVLLQKVSSSFFINISHQSHQSREFWRSHSYFINVAPRPIHNSKYSPRKALSSEKKRCVTLRYVTSRYVTLRYVTLRHVT